MKSFNHSVNDFIVNIPEWEVKKLPFGSPSAELKFTEKCIKNIILYLYGLQAKLYILVKFLGMNYNAPGFNKRITPAIIYRPLL